MRQSGDSWTITPQVPLQSLSEYGPTFMMPMAGDQLELRFPDGRVVSARIKSFGVEVWKDSDGNFYMNADPSDPVLTLTITSESDLSTMPAGTEVWLSEPKYASDSEAL